MSYRFHSTIMALLILSVLVLVRERAYSRQPTTLVSEGRSNYTILIASDSSPPQRYAAEELQTFLAQISGVKLPVSDQPTGGPMILGPVMP